MPFTYMRICYAKKNGLLSRVLLSILFPFINSFIILPIPSFRLVVNEYAFCYRAQQKKKKNRTILREQPLTDCGVAET